jgi:hypothetical protein
MRWDFAKSTPTKRGIMTYSHFFALVYVTIVAVTFFSIGVSLSLRVKGLDTLGKRAAKLGILSHHGVILGGIGMNIIHGTMNEHAVNRVVAWIIVVVASILYLNIENWKEIKTLKQVISGESGKN